LWDQCVRDADLTGRHPILIFRRNARQSCICFRRSYYLHVGRYYGKGHWVCKDGQYESFPNLINLRMGEESLVIMSLKQFFAWADPVAGFLSD